MRFPVRHLLLAAVTPVLLLPAAASAVCTAGFCVDAPPIKLDGDTGGGDNVICSYEKTDGDPPEGWGGDPDAGGPYLFFQTQAWGDQHPNDWNIRVCAPACPAPSNPLDVTVCPRD